MIRVKNIAVKDIRPKLPVPKYSAEPTKRLAIPPKPLNKATNSGIEVIFTKEAADAPTKIPNTKPITNHSYEMI